MPATAVTDAHALHGAQVVLMVPDVEDATTFYCDKLGFHLDFDHGDPPTHARVASGDLNHASAARIRLERENAPHAGPRHCYLYIHVGKDIDGLFREYEQRGVPVVEPPVDKPWGRQFTIRDLNGYELSFLKSE
ncbi:MAG: VOC family protein [Verrucomicrobia bacterium]|nr:VOC family protein [Verrucomicrobiota bacterium]